MADPAGMNNGIIDNPLSISLTQGGPYTPICGITSSSDAFNNALAEVTNNCSGENRTFLDGVGTKSLDTTVEGNYSTDAGFQIAFNAAISNTPVYLQRAIGSEFTLTWKGNFPTQNLSYPLSAATTASININSNGEYVLAPV